MNIALINYLKTRTHKNLKYILSSSNASTMVEILVGGSLVLTAGYMLSDAAVMTFKTRDKLDDNILMRRITDNITVEVSRNSNLFVPMGYDTNNNELDVYYNCYSETATLLKNKNGDIEFGLFKIGFNNVIQTKIEDPKIIDIDFIKKYKLGQHWSTDPSNNPNVLTNSPCEGEAVFVGYALPMHIQTQGINTYHVHIWAVSLNKDYNIKNALSTIATVAAY